MSIGLKRVQKITSKGQITLPVLWRKKFKTGQILIKTKNESLEISPFYLEKEKLIQSPEYTVFDAIRDNKGKGLKASDLLDVLKKIDK